MYRVYMRVSSGKQDCRSQDPDLRRWASGHDPVVLFYPHEKASGKNMDRTIFKRLYSECEPGDTIVVWRLDRLGRTAMGLTALFADMGAKRINLISLKDGIDLSTPAGRMIANVLASIAQFELEVRSERQIAGILAAKAQGRHWGGRPKGRMISEEQIEAIQKMHSTGARVASIARATGLSRHAVYDTIKPKYAATNA